MDTIDIREFLEESILSMKFKTWLERVSKSMDFLIIFTASHNQQFLETTSHNQQFLETIIEEFNFIL
jgi:hypothetical protein